MKNIVILAAGPPKKNRNRHLEIKSGKTVIDIVIDACKSETENLYAVVDKENIDLINHIKNKVSIIHPRDQKIYSTFEAALSIVGDTLMVAGDLVNVKSEDIKRFSETKYKSATSLYKYPWAYSNPTSAHPNLIRRSDLGDCMSLIAQEHKKEFLSNDNQVVCRWLYKQFNPNKPIDEYWYNDIGTYTSFAFFKEIYSNPDCNSFGEKGTVYFENVVYADND
jgi:molybdopterin-guanine dinucleotide biosynthesis protein A